MMFLDPKYMKVAPTKAPEAEIKDYGFRHSPFTSLATRAKQPSTPTDVTPA